MKETIFDIIHKAIKKHAGLTDFDDEAINEEVHAILKALHNKNYSIIKDDVLDLVIDQLNNATELVTEYRGTT